MSKWKLYDVDGALFHVNESTGELLEDEIRHVPKGTICITPDELEEKQKAQERKRLYLQCKREKEKRRLHSDVCGNFFFVSLDDIFNDLQPEMVAKLIYLVSFMDYEGVLKITLRKSMTVENLPEVLGVCDTTAWKFKKSVIPNYLMEEDDGTLKVNDVFFKKGALKKEDFYKWQKMYIQSIRQIYEKISERNHKHFGYILQLLPFVNLEYNVLCWNPLEEDALKVKPITLKEYCDLIGYNFDKVSRLLKIYEKITFDVFGRNECFVEISGHGADRASYKIFLNPNVMYCGTHYDDLIKHQFSIKMGTDND